MKFTPPVEVNGKLQVKAQSNDLTAGMKLCENKLVVYFMGKRPSFEAMKLAMTKLWHIKKEWNIDGSLHGVRFVWLLGTLQRFVQRKRILDGPRRKFAIHCRLKILWKIREFPVK